MLMKRLLACALLTGGLLTLRTPLHAQVERSGGGEAQRFMLQYQQVAAEKNALQAQLAQSKKDLDAANAELAAVKKERDAAKAHMGVPPAELAQATSSKEAAERSLEKSKQQITELVTRFREIAVNLRDTESARTQLGKELEARNGAFDKCVDANMQLYEINGQILDRYEHVGLFTKVSAEEPFTRLTRTRLENLVDEYRERAQQLHLKKAKP